MGHITLSLLEAELPRTFSKCCWEADGVSWPSQGCEAEPRHEPPVQQILLKLGWILAALCDQARISNTGIFFPLFFFYSIASAKIFSHPADRCDQKMVLEPCCWWEVSHRSSVHRLDALLTSTARGGNKESWSPGVQLYTLNVTVYDRIQSNQLYIHREAQN